MCGTKTVSTNLRRYVDSGFDKKFSTNTTSFNEGDDLRCELTELAMVKNNKKLSGEKSKEFFE